MGLKLTARQIQPGRVAPATAGPPGPCATITARNATRMNPKCRPMWAFWI